MTQTKPSGIYKLPNTDWYNDDISVMVEDILESGEIDNINAPQDIIDRLNDSNDASELADWISNNVVQLLEPTE